MAKACKFRFNANEKDILGEIGNMCAGNATTALAQILGKRIDLELPSVKVIDVADLPRLLKVDPEEPIIGIHMQIWGGARGNALMIFPTKDSHALIDLKNLFWWKRVSARGKKISRAISSLFSTRNRSRRS